MIILIENSIHSISIRIWIPDFLLKYDDEPESQFIDLLYEQLYTKVTAQNSENRRVKHKWNLPNLHDLKVNLSEILSSVPLIDSHLSLDPCMFVR